MLIDFHTHCFADTIHEKAIASLVELSGGFTPHHDGSLSGLIGSMDEAGVDISVAHSIATKEKQTTIINDWVISIQSERIIPFGTIHPDFADWEREIVRLKEAGIKGIKFHPDYQGFFVDDKRMYPIYEKTAEEGLIALFHSGQDIAFPDIVRNTPARFKKVLKDIPQLCVVGAHMGGHLMFDEVSEHLAGHNLYIDTSFAHYILGDEAFTALVKKHGCDKVLFGSDSPWDDAGVLFEIIDSLDFTTDEKEQIFYKNAQKLLKI
jgi:predicted TIM-barrel fold metal-dependent hydrolase